MVRFRRRLVRARATDASPGDGRPPPESGRFRLLGRRHACRERRARRIANSEWPMGFAKTECQMDRLVGLVPERARQGSHLFAQELRLLQNEICPFGCGQPNFVTEDQLRRHLL